MDPLKTIDIRRGLDALKAQQSTQVGSLTKGQQTPEAIKKAATDFEALLLHQMMNSMWSTVPKDTLFGQGNEDEIYRDMYTDAVTKDIAEKQGLGIKEVIIKELTKK